MLVYHLDYQQQCLVLMVHFKKKKKKIHGYGTKAVKYFNKDLNDMIKIVKALEDSDVLLKGVTETLKSDTKKCGALPMAPVLGASLLTGRGLYRAGFGNKCKYGQGMYRAGEGMYRAGQGIKRKSLMPPHPLTNFEIIEYFKDEPRYMVLILKIIYQKQ